MNESEAKVVVPVVSMAIDGLADAALRMRATLDAKHDGDAQGSDTFLICDACDQEIEGEPAGSGLYVWARGGEIRIEEPPLCSACATAIGMTALAQWSVEEEEG